MGLSHGTRCNIRRQLAHTSARSLDLGISGRRDVRNRVWGSSPWWHPAAACLTWQLGGYQPWALSVVVEPGTGGVLTVGELAICAGWPALGAVMAWMLARAQTRADISSDSHVATH